MATHRVPFSLVGFENDGAAWIGEVDFDPLRFQAVTHDPDDDGTSYWVVRVPENYSGTPVVDLSYVANATTGAWRLVLSTAVPADGESMDVTFSDETAVDTTVPGTAYQRDEISVSITGTTPAVGDLLVLRVLRDADNAADDLAVDLHILGIWFSYSDS